MLLSMQVDGLDKQFRLNKKITGNTHSYSLISRKIHATRAISKSKLQAGGAIGKNYLIKYSRT